MPSDMLLLNMQLKRVGTAVGIAEGNQIGWNGSVPKQLIRIHTVIQ